jgi:hypothetical protein
LYGKDEYDDQHMQSFERAPRITQMTRALNHKRAGETLVFVIKIQLIRNEILARYENQRANVVVRVYANTTSEYFYFLKDYELLRLL